MSNTWSDDDGDDDPWSGYGDTLEMELTPNATATVSRPVACEPREDEFAAAEARLQQRGQDLHQQHLRRTARRQQQAPHYFPHLEQGMNYGHGLSGRGYAPTHYYTPPPPPPVRYTPPVQHSPPAVIQVEPDPLDPAQTLPYEIDAYGNPILPDGMELDAWGNLVPRNDYYSNY
ncbi:MAG: hypothetical protein KF760_05860 [Candidatus Eremiobacteraeota bacterium]|nr:hypothetical protein [Candidatus Eremiobacteraeota bacterium]MCW5867080.1 hypothetical protein [Candidatus Eremiobacteraeota bacterium]